MESAIEPAAPIVSVIIPAWNAAGYIGATLNSLYQQSFKDFEIIIVNDGSTDNTPAFLNAHSNRHNITVVNQANRGQGAARNHGLALARGEYVLFLDSDDMLEPCTLQVALRRIEQDRSDVVVFDWKYLQRNGKYSYRHTTPYFGQELLTGSDCEQLLAVKSIFSVTALYRRAFLDRFQIQYLEGGIYEDMPFWTKVAISATRVSLVHSPLYTIRVHGASSTKTQHDTDRHARDFVRATRAAIDSFSARNPQSGYLLYKYCRSRFLAYYSMRTPPAHRGRFQQDFAKEISRLDFEIPENRDISTRILKRAGFFEGRHLWLFALLTLERTHRVRERVGHPIKKIRRRISVAVHAAGRACRKHVSTLVRPRLVPPEPQARAVDSCVLFLGFDFRYAGNSRYLFDELIANNRYELPVLFASNDERIPSEYRVAPDSAEFRTAIKQARVVILESWSPKNSVRRENQLWIQLWHGTPIKRMLFDSAETEIILRNRKHKQLKYYDTRRWTHFVSEGAEAAALFESSMYVFQNRSLPIGYPRVEYLRKAAGDNEARADLRAEIGIPSSKTAVLYAPTWRDYNYGRAETEADHSYLIDIQALESMLGDEYVIVYRGHGYLGARLEGSMRVILAPDLETQDLILACDVLLTDFSSILFDAAAIEKPVVLYVNDYERFEAGRGVYESVWTDLAPFVTHEVAETAELIRNYRLTDEVRALGTKYSPYDGSSPSHSLIKLINRCYGARARTLYFSADAAPDHRCLRYAMSCAERITVVPSIVTTSETTLDCVHSFGDNLVVSEGFGFETFLEMARSETWDAVFIEEGAVGSPELTRSIHPVTFALSARRTFVEATRIPQSS